MFKSTKKFISIILSMLMVVSSLSAFTITAGAETTDEIISEEYFSDEPVFLRAIIIGDVDFDQAPTVKDATQIQMYLSKFTEFNAYQLIAADTDKNNDVNIRDVTNIQLYAAKFPNEGSYVGRTITIEDAATPTAADTSSDPTVTDSTETVPPTTDAPVTDPTQESTVGTEPTYSPDPTQKPSAESEPTTVPTTAPTTAPTTVPTAPTEQATYGTEAVPMKGIDVSVHNGGDIDFHKVKAAGIQFVILRAGYGREISQKDKYFESNYLKAKAAGLKVGAYWYSYATSAADAVTEAKVCMSVISGKQFEFPIYFDLEEESQFAKGSAFCNSLITNFCTALEEAGYFAGLYNSTYYLNTIISSEIKEKYTLWVAQYASKCTYTGSYGMWQYTPSGKVNGISGNVDMNEGYIDYSGIIRNKAFNNYPKLGNGINPQLPIEEIVKEVFDGKWGNGDERKQRLTAAGYDYNVVQYRVQEYVDAGTRP